MKVTMASSTGIQPKQPFAISRSSLPLANKYPCSTVKGLPICKPFEAKVENCTDYPKAYAEFTDVFILVPYDTREDVPYLDGDIFQLPDVSDGTEEYVSDNTPVSNEAIVPGFGLQTSNADNLTSYFDTNNVSTDQVYVACVINNSTAQGNLNLESTTQGNFSTGLGAVKQICQVQVQDEAVHSQVNYSQPTINTVKVQKRTTNTSQSIKSCTVNRLNADDAFVGSSEGVPNESLAEKGNHGTKPHENDLTKVNKVPPRKRRNNTNDENIKELTIANEGKKRKITPNRVIYPYKSWITVKLGEHTDKFTIKQFASMEQKNRAKEVYKNLFCCLVCNGYKAGGEEEFQKHLENHLNGVLNCKGCPFVASTKANLAQHITSCFEGRQKVIKRKYQCDKCDMSYRRPLELQNHKGAKHGQLNFECNLCGEWFRSQHTRSRHFGEKHPKEKHFCSSCGKFYRSLTDTKYKLHVGTCSNKIKCHLCGTMLSNQRNSLFQHLRLKHENVRCFQCQHCPYSAKTKRNLERHQQVHAAFRHQQVHTGKTTYSCSVCTFTCEQKDKFDFHKRTHTVGPGSSHLGCEQCNYIATSKIQLKNHKKIHDSRIAVRCQLCNIVFKNDYQLNNHVKERHLSV